MFLEEASLRNYPISQRVIPTKLVAKRKEEKISNGLQNQENISYLCTPLQKEAAN
jgi:hypothetical protein